MNMTPGFAAQAARNAALALLAVATLVACGGGGGSTTTNSAPVPPGSPPASGQSTAISATPTTGNATVGSAPLQMTFTAANPRGSIASYEWDFKDNSPVAKGQTVQHTFMAPGAYNVTLTVRDSGGNFNRAALMVTVRAGSTQCSSAPTEYQQGVAEHERRLHAVPRVRRRRQRHRLRALDRLRAAELQHRARLRADPHILT